VTVASLCRGKKVECGEIAADTPAMNAANQIAGYLPLRELKNCVHVLHVKVCIWKHLQGRWQNVVDTIRYGLFTYEFPQGCNQQHHTHGFWRMFCDTYHFL
jgi:hypothetical protein